MYWPQSDVALRQPGSGPVFVLRGCQSEQQRGRAKATDRPRRQRRDLKCLQEYEDRQTPGPKFAQKCHVSCVIMGSSDWRWTCYSFVDAVVGSEDGEDLAPWDPEHMEELNEDPLT